MDDLCPLVQTVQRGDASTTIDCGQTLSGSVLDGDDVIFEFINDIKQDVTFTNCDSNFDPTLFLYDSNDNEIQSQSSNKCSGDDCSDSTICSTSDRETFTMEDLAVGTYQLKLKPYSQGGEYKVEVFCGSDGVSNL